MAIICPTVTAFDTHTYRTQMERIEPFCERVHIDLMDGVFAPTTSPGLDQVWWPSTMAADIHLMYQQPMNAIEQLISLKPQLVIIHYEAVFDHQQFTEQLHDYDIKVGLALLRSTTVKEVLETLLCYDHVLVFSGDLGKHGGLADTSLLDKVGEIRAHHPEAEISWDGGVNDQNAATLIGAGIDVLNVGGFIQNSDDPAGAYAKLKAIG